MASVKPTAAYEEVLDFLASTPTPQQIVTFRPSAATQRRASYLLDANRAGSLTPVEQAELNEFGHVEHLMRLLKSKAREKLDMA